VTQLLGLPPFATQTPFRGKSRAAANFWEGGRPLEEWGHAREERGEESPSAGESRPPVPGPSSWDGVTPSQLHYKPRGLKWQERRELTQRLKRALFSVSFGDPFLL
jgi:hypothetical protein